MVKKLLVALFFLSLSLATQAHLGPVDSYELLWDKSLNPQSDLWITDPNDHSETDLKYDYTYKQQDLEEFYTEEDFSTDIYAEIHSRVLMSEAAITEAQLKKVFPDACDKVIDEIATTVRNELPEVLLDGPKDIEVACPQWKHLDNEAKYNFYVGLLTAMAIPEASCSNKAVNAKAKDGTAYGLWQLPQRLSAKAGARDTLRRIEIHVKQSGLLFFPDSKLNYWAVLNPKLGSHKVKRILKKIPGCVTRAMTKWDKFN